MTKSNSQYILSSPASAAQTASGVLRIAAWSQYPWLRHGFSTRLGGVSTVYAQPADLNLGWTADDTPENVAANRQRFLAELWQAPADSLPTLVTVRQIHSAVSHVIPASVEAFVRADGRAACEGDGLFTAVPGIALGVQTADCVPVLLVDPARRAVAGFHAGWRGTVARIVEHGVSRMQQEFGSRPEELLAAIGPSIGACCYPVGAEAIDAFHAAFDYADALFPPEPVAGSDPTLRRLDLWEANRRQLLAAGLAPAHISLVGECTACTGLPGPLRYFSHRAERGFTGRMLSAIGITEA